MDPGPGLPAGCPSDGGGGASPDAGERVLRGRLPRRLGHLLAASQEGSDRAEPAQGSVAAARAVGRGGHLARLRGRQRTEITR